MEGACSSVGDFWKGLGIRSTLKCLWNSCSNYRVEIDAVGIKNLEDLTNRNSSVTVRTLIY